MDRIDDTLQQQTLRLQSKMEDDQTYFNREIAEKSSRDKKNLAIMQAQHQKQEYYIKELNKTISNSHNDYDKFCDMDDFVDKIEAGNLVVHEIGVCPSPTKKYLELPEKEVRVQNLRSSEYMQRRMQNKSNVNSKVLFKNLADKIN